MEAQALQERLGALTVAERRSLWDRLDRDVTLALGSPDDPATWFRTAGGVPDQDVSEHLVAALALEEGHETSLVGTEVGHIEIQSVLGRGGMGAVYLGVDTWLDRQVAVKALLPRFARDPRWRERFRAEARALSRLDHPRICRIHDLTHHAGQDYLVLEYIEGTSLGVRAEEPIDLETRLRIGEDIAEGLSAAHAEGLVHRDLKPGNVQITPDGRARILDFGLAAVEGGGAESDHIVGTPAYMSPEQARGDAPSAASDCFALGLVLLELFGDVPARRLRREDGSLDLDAARGGARTAFPGRRGDLREWTRLVEGLLDPEPAARPTARTTAVVLAGLRRGPTRRRRRAVAAASILLLVALVTFAAIGWSRADQRRLLLPAEGGRIALLPIRNETGDPDHDWVSVGLTSMMGDALDQARGVDLVPKDVVTEMNSSGELDVAALERFGADLLVRLVLRSSSRGLTLESETLDARGSIGRRRVTGGEALVLGNEMARDLAQRLSPEAFSVDLADRFSLDPLVNQMYAVGLSVQENDGAASAPYFEACLQRDPDFGWAALGLADLANRRADNEAVAAHLQRTVEIARQRRDERLLAEALQRQAIALAYARELEEAEARFDEAGRLFRDVGEASALARLIYERGRARFFNGDREGARSAWLEGLERARDSGDRLLEGDAWNALGLWLRNHGRLEEEARNFENALAIYEELGLRRRIAIAMGNVAFTYASLERTDEAFAIWDRLIPLLDDLGERLTAENARMERAAVWVGTGDPRGVPALERMLAGELLDLETQALVRFHLARGYAEAGRWAPAQVLLEEVQNLDGTWVRDHHDFIELRQHVEAQVQRSSSVD